MDAAHWSGQATGRSSPRRAGVFGGGFRAMWPCGGMVFGIHGEVAAHYGRVEGQYEPHATTLDYVVAAAAG
jgi:hypothetical protein